MRTKHNALMTVAVAAFAAPALFRADGGAHPVLLLLAAVGLLHTIEITLEITLLLLRRLAGGLGRIHRLVDEHASLLRQLRAVYTVHFHGRVASATGRKASGKCVTTKRRPVQKRESTS